MTFSFRFARTRAASTAALAALALEGCATPKAPTPLGLADTSWSLRAIQSMDDSQGTTRIADAARFRLRFGADGRVALKLDCNRGTANWQASPSADGQTGSLRLGPIAGTRARCAPPHLDERVVRDLGYVAGYRFDGGRRVPRAARPGGGGRGCARL